MARHNCARCCLRLELGARDLPGYWPGARRAVFFVRRVAGRRVASQSSAVINAALLALVSPAAVVPGVLEGRIERTCRVDLPGGPLDIEWRESDGKSYMTGPAELVFSGSVKI